MLSVLWFILLVLWILVGIAVGSGLLLVAGLLLCDFIWFLRFDLPDALGSMTAPIFRTTEPERHLYLNDEEIIVATSLAEAAQLITSDDSNANIDRLSQFNDESPVVLKTHKKAREWASENPVGTTWSSYA